MQFYKNFLKKNKTSKAQVLFGILYILIAFAWIYMRIYDEKKPIFIFDWIYSFLFILGGLVQILEGMGFAILGLFGKAFILVNNNGIKYKTHIGSKAQDASWEEIDKVNFNPTHIEVVCKNKPNFLIKYSKFEYTEVQTLKNTISEFLK